MNKSNKKNELPAKVGGKAGKPKRLPKVKTAEVVPVKRPVGHPEKYKPEYCQAMLDYFSVPATRMKEEHVMTKNGLVRREVEVANPLPTIEGFCRSIDISKVTLHNWLDKHQDLMNAYKKCKDATKEILNQNALMGRYSEGYAKFVAINCTDMIDKKNVESDMAVTINIVNYSHNGD